MAAPMGSRTFTNLLRYFNRYLVCQKQEAPRYISGTNALFGTLDLPFKSTCRLLKTKETDGFLHRHRSHKLAPIFSRVHSGCPTLSVGMAPLTVTQCNRRDQHGEVLSTSGSCMPSLYHTQSRGFKARREPEELYETREEALERQRLEAEDEDHAWILRTSVEKTYLSWVRNCYTLTIAGVIVYTQLMVPLAQETAVVFLLSSGVSLITGTVLYIYAILGRRRRMAMSAPTALLLSTLAAFHVVVWVAGILVYLGYVEDEESHLEGQILFDSDETEENRGQNRRDNKGEQGGRKKFTDKYD